MKVLIMLLAVGMVLTGCSHNVVQYSDGVGFETVLRPDTGNFGVTFRYGKILSAVLRENAEVEMVGEGSGGGGNDASGTTTAAASGTVKLKVGKQITGYYVDAIEAGAKPAELEVYTKPEVENE